MIYYDPTEGRENTKLDVALLEAGEAVQGLEAVTGADLLVTAQELSTLDASKPAGKLALESACKSGILIQRKSGHDFLGSIPNLGSIAARMNACDPLGVYLAIDGRFFSSDTGMTVCNGRHTNWNYNAFVGAIDAWQIYGGFVMQFDNADGLCKWVLHRNKNVKKMLMDKPKTVMAKSRKQTQHLLIDTNPQKGVLMAFPHVGDVGANVILDYCGGSLAWSLSWMSDPDATMNGVGIAKKTAWRAYLGLRDDEILAVCSTDGGIVQWEKLIDDGK